MIQKSVLGHMSPRLLLIPILLLGFLVIWKSLGQNRDGAGSNTFPPVSPGAIVEQDIGHEPHSPPMPPAVESIPVRMHVMSKCPDAVKCEAVMSEVKKILGPAVTLDLQYILRNGNCPHGEQECEGNYQQLCAKKVGTYDQWWSFVQCQNANWGMGIPGNMGECANSAKIDQTALKQCAGSEEAKTMLKDSAEYSESAGALRSCTVFINNEQHCVMDGGSWSPPVCEHTEQDLVRKICSLMKNPPEACKPKTR